MIVPDNFGGLKPEHCDLARARFVVLPAPYDGTTTFLKGTRHGPRAVITASQQVELYDEELERETALEAGIATLPIPPLEAEPPERVPEVLERLARPHFEAGKCVVTIGGEHSVSLGPIRAAKAQHAALSVLHIDAHADLRAEYDGTPFGHGCVMRRVLEAGIPITQVGIRSLSPEEAALVREGRVRTFFAHRTRDVARAAKEIVATLPTKDVYVSIDIDALDPSLVAGTGTPEPGGLSWWDMLALLREAAGARRIVGFDLVETLPLAGQAVSEFVAARIIYRFMGYISGIVSSTH